MTLYNHLLSPALLGLQPYTPGEQPKMDNLIKLNTNECPFPPAPGVVPAIIAALGEDGAALRLYPDPDATVLRQAIASFHQLPLNQVFAGNGSDEVLAHIFMAFFRQGTERPLLFPDISYSFYPVYARLYEVATRIIPLQADFSLKAADYHGPAGGIIIANPNAPTGMVAPLAEIEALLADHPGCVVVIDEAYADFGTGSAIALIDRYPNLLVCQTTSKSRSLAGMRIGMAFGQPHLITALETVKNSFNSYPMDRLAIAAGAASFEDRSYFEQTCQTMIRLRDTLVSQLKQLEFNVLPSGANFVFASHARLPASRLQQQLREKAIIVRHFNTPRIDNFLRITVGNATQNTALIEALAQITGEPA